MATSAIAVLVNALGTQALAQSTSAAPALQPAVGVLQAPQTPFTAAQQRRLELPRSVAEPTLPEVKVEATGDAQRRFDAASSHTAVRVDGFEAASPLVNLSELLADQAGVVALDRGNYAQDLQIAIRGFGTRATFGVRGVRILVDGIPATMPDGQGQAATAQLSSASEVNVLRGPLAQLYGNAAGGVLQVRTREPRPGGGAAAQVAVGSHGDRLVGASIDVGDRSLGGLIDVTRFSTDGYRPHSAAERTHLNSKWVARPGADTTLTALVNLYDQPRAQDPLGLTRAQFDANPRQRQPLADRFDTRKSVAQNQLALVWEQRLSASDSLRAQVYGGTRALQQFLAFSGEGAASSGGVVDLDRRYRGAAMSWTHQMRLPTGRPAQWTLGMSADRLAEDRRGFVNALGAAGALRRSETDRAGTTDVFGQVDALLTDELRLVAGLRASRVELDVRDRFVTAANPDDSGSTRFAHISPALGVVWSASDQLNVYANLGRGFETPTLSETAYRLGGTGPNFALGAARTRQYELGAKWQGEVHSLQAAWFDARTRGEIVPAAVSGGRTVFQNADAVQRRGVELGWQAKAGNWTPRAAFTWLDASFAAPYSGADGAAVAVGNRLPGTARQVLHVSLDHAPAPGWRWGADVHVSGKVFADDRNSQAAAGYGVLGLHVAYSFAAAGARWNAWARADNLLDRSYAGSLVVNDGNGRYFEPASGRRITLGLRTQF